MHVYNEFYKRSIGLLGYGLFLAVDRFLQNTTIMRNQLISKNLMISTTNIKTENSDLKIILSGIVYEINF